MEFEGQKVAHNGDAQQVALATQIWGRDGGWQDATTQVAPETTVAEISQKKHAGREVG